MAKKVVLLLWGFLIGFTLMVGQSNNDLDKQIAENDAKAENYLSEKGKENAAAQLYNQSAYLLRSSNRLEEAATYYQKVLEINISLGNRRGQMISHNSLSMVYLESENYPKAVYHLRKELEFRKQVNNKSDIINVLTNLAFAENQMSGFDSAIDNIEQAIKFAKELNDLVLLKQCYGVAYDIYEKMGNSTKSYEYFEMYSAIDRKLKEQKMAEITHEADRKVIIAESEKQFTQKQLSLTSEELEKTVSTLHEAEKLTREQQLEIELNELEKKALNAVIENERIKSRYKTISLTILLVFVFILAWLVLNILKANKKINQQRSWLEKQNKEIKASIRYAQTIQQAILPANSEIEKHFDTFILYMPKDIVSGDFYWITSRQEGTKHIVFFAVVDCTGHGVPGAFMSMIGNRILNEIIVVRKTDSPAEVLGLMNIMVRQALRQEETDNNDGMDMALCKFEINPGKEHALTFAGAKRPIYIIKDNENKLLCHNGDRKSIGGYSLSKRDIVFTDYQQKIEKGDMIYLFSDGIVDQNSPERKKFGRIRLEETMIDCARLRTDEQKVIFEQRLRDYMSSEEQRDDITLVGLKVV